ncbi:MAG: hypothetical protein AAGG48_07980 [Planctomycetota bacterium]
MKLFRTVLVLCVLLQSLALRAEEDVPPFGFGLDECMYHYGESSCWVLFDPMRDEDCATKCKRYENKCDMSPPYTFEIGGADYDPLGLDRIQLWYPISPFVPDVPPPLDDHGWLQDGIGIYHHCTTFGDCDCDIVLVDTGDFIRQCNKKRVEMGRWYEPNINWDVTCTEADEIPKVVTP